MGWSIKNRRIGWGVIGCGGIADKRTIPGMLLSRKCRLVGVMDKSQAVAAEVAGRYRCETFKNVDALLRSPEIDAVYIASPVVCHPEHVQKAADAGKQILCEKPLAVTIAECREVLRYCHRKKVHLMLGFMMRFHPIHQLLHRWVADGKLGRVIMARAQLSHFHVEYNADGSRNWRQDPKKSGGGSLMDMGIHCVDLLRFFLGKEVESVSARVATLANNYKVEDTGVLLLNFSEGAIGIADSTFAVQGAQHAIEIYGSRGSVFVDNSISQVEEGNIWTVFDGRKKKYPYKKHPHCQYSMYMREIDEMNDCILEEREPRYPARDGVIDQAIVQTGYRASAGGRCLKIPVIR